MRIYRETAIRKQSDKPTIAMLDLWHSLSEQTTGYSIEVVVGNRKEQRQLSSFSGELYTAIPQIIEGKVRLILWLDSVSDAKTIFITHEIGHWVLKLQGFMGFINRSQKNSNIEILLNSMAHHPPLYAIQRSIGHEPQEEIDSRCLHNIRLFSKGKEAQQRELRIQNALILADDIFNSEENRYPLINVISRRHPNTSELLNKIIKLESSYNLLVPDQNKIFCKQIIDSLKLSGDWYNPDEVKSLVSLINKVNSEKP